MAIPEQNKKAPLVFVRSDREMIKVGKNGSVDTGYDVWEMDTPTQTVYFIPYMTGAISFAEPKAGGQ